MRALPTPLAPLALAAALTGAATSGCADDPCRDTSGGRLYVFGPDADHRLAGSDPTSFATIAEALASSERGNAICVGPGTWSEPLRLPYDDLKIMGAGPELTVIEADEALIASGGALISVEGADALLSGLSVHDAPTGVSVAPGAGLTMETVELEGNDVGLSAMDPSYLLLRDVGLLRNRLAGATVDATLAADAVATLIHGGRIEGNGDIARSSVGGLRADGDVVMSGVHLRDNAGLEVGDVDAGGHLDAYGLLLERPATVYAGAPRLRAGDGLDLADAELHVFGSTAAQVTCGERELLVENVVFSDAWDGVIQSQLVAEGCGGHVLHATFANLGGGSQGPAIALSGSSRGDAMTITNTAMIGFDVGRGLAAWGGELLASSNFEGDITEAQLISPLDPMVDVRPLSDSPLLDTGEATGVEWDIHGAARPRGAGPDIGAYEY